MLELDEIFYNALTADSEIASATGGRIFSTCVEVPPMDQDNTPLPCIIVTDHRTKRYGRSAFPEYYNGKIHGKAFC